jgi:cytochrome c-type biogenesis protein CcmH/NrfG
MGLFTGLLTLPLAPVRGTVWLAQQVMAQADREWHDPASVRRQLEEVDRLRAEGSLSDEEAEAMEDELVGRLLTGQGSSFSGWEE